MGCKISYTYGVMGSGKTESLINKFEHLTSLGYKILATKPNIDTRTAKICSRNGQSISCFYLSEVFENNMVDNTYDYIIVDEAQFLSNEDLNKLLKLSEINSIDILFYGLLEDYMCNMFESSKRLLSIANEVKKVKRKCWCGKEATVSTLIVDGKVFKKCENDNINVNGQYTALCKEHYDAGIFKTIDKFKTESL